MHTPEQRRKKLNLMLSFLSALPLKQSVLELCEENFTKVEGWGGCCEGSLFYSELSFANQGFSVVLKNLV